MKKLNLILLTLLTTTCLFSQSWEWANAYHSDATNSVHSISETSEGDIVISGIMRDATIFGTDTLLMNGANMMAYIAKMTPDGTPLWAKPIFTHNWTPQTPGAPASISLTSDNSILMSSQFTDSLVLGNETLYDTNGGKFIALFDSDGNYQWAKNFGDRKTPGTSVGNNSENFIDDDGNIYLTGTFKDTAYFETNTLVWNDGGIFIVKFDQFGNEQWVSQCGRAGGWQSGYDITTDDAQNVYITGTVSSGESQFGSTTVVTPSWRNISYISKINPLGNFEWTMVGGSPTDFLDGVQIVPSTYGVGIETDGTDNVYFTGFFSDTVQFGSQLYYPNCIGPYCTNFFLAAYDLEGNFKWLTQSEVATPASNGSDMKIDDEGNIYILGTFRDSIAFNGLSVTSSLSTNTSDLFIAKFDPQGECIGLIHSDTKTNNGRISLSCENQSIRVGSSYIGSSGNLGSLGLDESEKVNIFVGSVSNSFECSVTSVKDEIKLNRLSVYPNPFNDYLQIDFADEESAAGQVLNVQIYNAMGQLVHSLVLEDAGQQIDCRHLGGGLFYLQLVGMDGKLVGEALKVVKVE